MTLKDHDLVASAKEMLLHANGRISLSRREIAVPDKVEVSTVRKRLGYNQREFAEAFGFTLSAIKDWEQGRRTPERPARVLLALIAANPKLVEETLAKL